jgi:hypothetical protein
MHKKGITEEVAKKRSRRTIKHQRGIVGADLAAIAAKRNQTAAVRSQQRLAAIAKAKNEKKEKEVKKAKVRSTLFPRCMKIDDVIGTAPACAGSSRTKSFQAADEGREGWSVDTLHGYLGFSSKIYSSNRWHLSFRILCSKRNTAEAASSANILQVIHMSGPVRHLPVQGAEGVLWLRLSGGKLENQVTASPVVIRGNTI